MESPITVAELLTRIRSEHARLVETYARLSEVEMMKPGVAGSWSIKDCLAHVTWWEQRMLRIVQHGLQGERPSPVALEQGLPQDETWLDHLNERVFGRYQNEPLQSVLAQRRTSFAQVMQVMESLSDADLAEASALARAIGEPAHPLIKGDTYEHYQLHADAIRAWLDRADR